MLLRCETLLSPLAVSKDIALDAKTRPLEKTKTKIAQSMLIVKRLGKPKLLKLLNIVLLLLAAHWMVITLVALGAGLRFVNNPWVTEKNTHVQVIVLNGFSLTQIWRYNTITCKHGTSVIEIISLLTRAATHLVLSSFTISLKASDFRMPPMTRTPPAIQATNSAGPKVYLRGTKRSAGLDAV